MFAYRFRLIKCSNVLHHSRRNVETGVIYTKYSDLSFRYETVRPFLPLVTPLEPLFISFHFILLTAQSSPSSSFYINLLRHEVVIIIMIMLFHRFKKEFLSKWGGQRVLLLEGASTYELRWNLFLLCFFFSVKSKRKESAYYSNFFSDFICVVMGEIQIFSLLSFLV